MRCLPPLLQVKAHLPPPGKSTQVRRAGASGRVLQCLRLTGAPHMTQVLVCGPPPMIKFACKPAFEELGYTDDMQLIW